MASVSPCFTLCSFYSNVVKSSNKLHFIEVTASQPTVTQTYIWIKNHCHGSFSFIASMLFFSRLLSSILFIHIIWICFFLSAVCFCFRFVSILIVTRWLSTLANTARNFFQFLWQMGNQPAILVDRQHFIHIYIYIYIDERQSIKSATIFSLAFLISFLQWTFFCRWKSIEYMLGRTSSKFIRITISIHSSFYYFIFLHFLFLFFRFIFAL